MLGYGGNEMVVGVDFTPVPPKAKARKKSKVSGYMSWSSGKKKAMRKKYRSLKTSRGKKGFLGI